MMRYTRLVLLALLSMASLTACGDKTGDSQVIAKVNGDEITVHQINYVMSRLGNVPTGKEDEARKQVLKDLVDQQLLVELAVDKKLNRNPNVLQAVETAKRQILAQASLEQMAQQLTEPTATEIHDYYVKSPELFANRRVYKFGEVSMASSTQIETVKQMLAGIRSLEEFAEKLRKENIPFKTAVTVKAAEDLPTVLLPRFSKMTKGEVAIIPTGDNLSVLQLQDFKEQPLTEEQAKGLIARFLMEQKRKTLLEAEMKKLRDSAKTQYFGVYANAAKAQQDGVAAQPAVSAVTAAAPQASPGKAEVTQNNHIEKGLAGLK